VGVIVGGSGVSVGRTGVGAGLQAETRRTTNKSAAHGMERIITSWSGSGRSVLIYCTTESLYNRPILVLELQMTKRTVLIAAWVVTLLVSVLPDVIINEGLKQPSPA
jgi:hypothetical protein